MAKKSTDLGMTIGQTIAKLGKKGTPTTLPRSRETPPKYKPS